MEPVLERRTGREISGPKAANAALRQSEQILNRDEDDSDGTFPGYRGADTDVTERERAEAAVRESQQCLSLIYNALSDVIFQVAVEPKGQFRFVSVNAAFPRVTGLSLEMVIGKTVNEVIPEPSLTMVLEKYRQVVEEKTIGYWQETSDYPSGRLTGEVSVVPVIDNKGTCTHLVGSVRDITERKRAEDILRESEERFRSIADAAPVMIWVSGRDKLCTFFNKPWLDFTGRTMEQELGNGWVIGVHPGDLNRCLGIYVSSFDSRRSFRMEYRIRRADGEYRWLLDNGTPHYRDDEFIGFIGSCIDVTEQKQIEERLRASEQQLQTLAESLIRAQEDENRRVSRELHDDLTQQLAGLGIQAAALSKCSAKVPHAIRRQMSDLSREIGNLADDVHQIACRLHPASLQDLGLEVALRGECAFFVQRRGLRVQFMAEDVPRFLPGDVALCLFRVAQESLGNVAKHAGAREVSVRLARNKAGLGLFIKDNGGGFDVAQARGKGGLGLISMEERVRIVNGEFKIRSEAGLGTNVEVHLPLPELETR
jgi:PAS domain S-box-containing protein